MAKAKSSRPSKMKAYASFADWKGDQSLRNQKLIASLSSLIKKVAPDLTKTVKWGQGCWALNQAPKIYIHAEPDHLHFGFYAGSTLKDPEKLLVGSGKHVRHVKIYTSKDISTKALTAFIKQVI